MSDPAFLLETGKLELAALLDHVSQGGPHEWGYRDPVVGGFIADDWPFRAMVALDRCLTALKPEAVAEVVELRAHIAEQITHAETRIGDGIEMGATVWRLALEDIVRENRAILAIRAAGSTKGLSNG